MVTRGFLEEIYKGCKDGYITLNTIPEKETFWFKVNELDKAEKKAAELGKKTNTFFGVNLRKKQLGLGLRGSDHDIHSVNVLYADIDVKGAAHAETALPETREIALQFMGSLPVKPSIIVWSGNGMHVYWLLNEPFIINSKQEMEQIKGIVSSWGRHINERAKILGWRIDSVYDIARILRIPGTLNHKLKDKSECKVMESNGTRYSIDTFKKYSSVSKPVEERAVVKRNTEALAERITEKCSFIRHCRDNAKTLPEPYWHAMISNLALTKGGAEVVHEYSRDYPKYDKTETEKRIRRALKEDKPHTCSYIQEALGFTCNPKCTVKAPIVHGSQSMEELVKELVAKENVDIDEVFSEQTIKAMAYAKKSLPAEYTRYKQKLKNKVSIRDFENALKSCNKDNGFSIEPDADKPIKLDGIELKGAVLPHGWDVTMKNGVRKYATTSEGTVVSTICPSPIVISRKFENIDDFSTKVELAYFNNRKWKRLITSPSQVFNKNSIMKFADNGIPVSSDSSGDLVKYLWDYDLKNISGMEITKSISRIGWFDNCNQFYPFVTKDEVIYDSTSKEGTDVMAAIHKEGSYELWKENVLKARENPIARFLISASFASPLLEPLKHRIFFVHIWHDSKSGKTAAVKLGLSVWGDPKVLLASFNATSVGLERMAAALNNLPFAIDELQVLNERRISAETIIYGLSMGFGRLRGAKEGGLQDKTEWNDIVITTGEQPISKENSNDGVLSRVFELYSKPVDNEDFAHELHIISENNFGHGGEEYLRYILGNNVKGKKQLKEMYDKLRDEISEYYNNKEKSKANSQLDNVAVVCLGDYLSSVSVFGLSCEEAWKQAISLGYSALTNNRQLEKVDTIERAWEFVEGWLVSNTAKFTNDTQITYGLCNGSTYYIIPAFLRAALEEQGFDYSKVTRGFKDRGYITTRRDAKGNTRMQYQKRINGKSCKVIEIQLDPSEDNAAPLIGKS